jgi:hypothetical protein
MHAARGTKQHALAAIESGTVRWIDPQGQTDACLLLESDSCPGLYYMCKHLNACGGFLFVRAGQHVARGERLAYIWGDHNWGHLHFAVAGYGPPPTYANRYTFLLNACG